MPSAIHIDRSHPNPGDEAAHRPATESRIDRLVRRLVKSLGSFAMMGKVITQLPGIGEVGHPPTVEVVFSHALFSESLEFFGIAGSLSPEQTVTPDLLGGASVVDLIKLVPAAELGG